MALLSPTASLPHGTSRVEDIDPDQMWLFDAEVRLFCSPVNSLTVQAAPMKLGKYLELRGWKPEKSEDLEQKGYLVERPDMGPPNQPGFKNFIAWLPKENFDRFYEPLGKPNS
jgi:hypothetical protein